VFEAAIVILAIMLWGHAEFGALLHGRGQLIAPGLFISANFASAFLALESAIPGREVRWPHLLIAAAIAAVAIIIEPLGMVSGMLEGAPNLMMRFWALAALPWLSLFWLVRRGVPLQPELSGAAVGLAAFCFAAALCAIMSRAVPVAEPGLVLAFGAVIIGLSALAGRLGLNWIARWQDERPADEVFVARRQSLAGRALFPLALSAAAAALILTFKVPGWHVAPIPEFDVAIESYEQALAGFRPNVPSSSMDTMLTAYAEHGMPAYMWDFEPEGFKLIGGRWAPLSDGTPVTYTWFRGTKGGVMCIFRHVDTFSPPPQAHEERHNLLFYRYRDFSFCLINVGGYGNFISVIAAPMPLKQFEHLVLAATL
jgi:hypothetical protein